MTNPLLLRAREIASKHVTCPAFVLAGNADAWPEVKCALDGLRDRDATLAETASAPAAGSQPGREADRPNDRAIVTQGEV